LRDVKKAAYITLSFLFSVAFVFFHARVMKNTKSDDYNLKYAKAFEYYGEEEFLRSGNVFDQIAPVFRGTKKQTQYTFIRP